MKGTKLKEHKKYESLVEEQFFTSLFTLWVTAKY